MNETVNSPFENPDTREYWAAAQSGRLMVQRCSECGTSYAYPRPYCVRCFSDRVSLIETSGRGRIYAKTVVHLPAAEGGETGYAVALVELDEGVRLLARLDGAGGETGQQILLWWDLSADKPLLRARVTDEAGH